MSPQSHPEQGTAPAPPFTLRAAVRGGGTAGDRRQKFLLPLPPSLQPAVLIATLAHPSLLFALA